MQPKIIAVDFDGTLCENEWPGIGKPIERNIQRVKAWQAAGAKLILWTNRVTERLSEAVDWCADHGIVFDAVNENLPEILDAFGTDCRKIYADVYFDDRAVNPERGSEPDEDFMTIMICSVRYAIGRRTYITSIVPKYVAKHVRELDDKALYVLHKDIVEHGRPTCKQHPQCDARGLYPDSYGDPCDYRSWMELLDAVEAEMNRRAKEAGI